MKNIYIAVKKNLILLIVFSNNITGKNICYSRTLLKCYKHIKIKLVGSKILVQLDPTWDIKRLG